MTEIELLELINLRKENNLESVYKLYDYYEDLNKDLALNLMFEIVHHSKCNKEYLYKLINICDNELKKYYVIYGHKFLDKLNKENEFEKMFNEIIKQESKLPEYKSYSNNGQNAKEIDKIILKIRKTSRIKKKEKILTKALNYEDARIYYEFGNLLIEKNNIRDAMSFFKLAAKENYKEAILYLLDSENEYISGNDKLDLYMRLASENDEKSIMKICEFSKNCTGKEILKAIPYFMFLIENDDVRKLLGHILYKVARNSNMNESKLYYIASLLIYFSTTKYDGDSINNKNDISSFYNAVVKTSIDTTLNNELRRIELNIKMEEKRLEKEREIQKLNSQYPNKKVKFHKILQDYKIQNPKLINDTSKKEGFYFQAKISKENYEIVPLLIKAADLGHSKAMMSLYELYKNDDIEIAYKYLSMAKEYGNPDVPIDKYEKLKKHFDEIENEERKEKLRLEEEERKLNPLGLDKDPNYEKYENEKANDYEKRVKLYQEALNTKDVEEIIAVLTKAADAGHPKAIYSLAKYYHDKDNKKFEYYIFKANDWELDPFILSDLDLNFDLVYKLAISGNEFWIIELCQYHISKLNESQVMLLQNVAIQKKIDISFYLRQYYKSRNNNKYIEYEFLSALKGDDFNFIMTMSELARKGEINLIKQDYIDFLLSAKYRENFNVVWCIYDILMNSQMRNKFTLPYKYADGIYLLHSLEDVCDKYQKRLLYQKLAECYEKGIGVVKDVYKASDYYAKAKDNKKASEIVREYDKQKRQEENTYNAAFELMKAHPCPELDKWLATGNTKAKNIVKRYGEVSKIEALNDMIERDRLLALGFSLDEMHDQNGMLISWTLAKKIAERESALKMISQQNYYGNSNNNTVSTNTEQNVVIDNSKPIELIENNVKVTLFGKINEDPDDPDYNSVGLKNFSAVHYSVTTRKNKEWCEASYGDFEAFYIESLVINGEKINEKEFCHHLNLTLDPGVYSVKITVVLKRHFLGYSPSMYASNRLNASDYWIKSSVKNKWIKYRKSFIIESFNVRPGKIQYLAFFATLYGEWYRIYDEYSNRYEGKERKNIVSDFVFKAFTEEQVKQSKSFYYMEDEDFISLEDIGKDEYNPLLKYIEK